MTSTDFSRVINMDVKEKPMRFCKYSLIKIEKQVGLDSNYCKIKQDKCLSQPCTGFWKLSCLFLAFSAFNFNLRKTKTLPAFLDREQANQFLDRCSLMATVSQVSASWWETHKEASSIINIQCDKADQYIPSKHVSVLSGHASS